VLATQRAIPTAPALAPPLIWQVPPVPVEHPSTAAAAASTTTPAPAWTAPSMPAVTISPDIPAPALVPFFPGPTADPAPGAMISTVPAGLPPAGHVPLDAHVVDEPPVMLSHPAINYPEVLRLAGIEGRVLVEAVLDTLGRIESASPRISQSPNPLFDREALAVVLGSRYRPGRVDGHAVRVRIRVPVTFSINR